MEITCVCVAIKRQCYSVLSLSQYMFSVKTGFQQIIKHSITANIHSGEVHYIYNITVPAVMFFFPII